MIRPDGSISQLKQAVEASEANKNLAHQNMLAAAEDLAQAGVVIGVGTSKRVQRTATVAIRFASDPEMAIIFRAIPNTGEPDSSLNVYAQLISYADFRRSMEIGSALLEESITPTEQFMHEPTVPNTQQALLDLIKSVPPERTIVTKPITTFDLNVL